MNLNAKIYVAGHLGLVGSAIMRHLKSKGYNNIISRTHNQLDLTNQQSVASFFALEKPEYLFLAAAKVGGIYANNTYPAEFIFSNLAIQNNIIHQSYLSGVKRLLFLGSSCIYPRDCLQPIKEDYLLSGVLEATNRPYAVAKIAGIEMCWSYNRQYGTKYLAVMPSNLFGKGDNYHPENSHVIPALIRKFHEAKIKDLKSVYVWGSGAPKREFLFSDDMAEACIFLLNLDRQAFDSLVAKDSLPPLINLGSNREISIAELANLIKEIIGFKGKITFDRSKPDGVMQKLIDSGRLNALGWKTKTNLSDGIYQAYEDFKSLQC